MPAPRRVGSRGRTLLGPSAHPARRPVAGGWSVSGLRVRRDACQCRRAPATGQEPSPARAAGQDTVAVVGHGTAIRCWSARRADNLDAATLERRPLENTGVVVLQATPQGARPWTCRTWMGAPPSGIGAHAPAGPAGAPLA
ncbi:histidine phosphatase family protein [Kocuria sp.]|uniref:histidine phosphatase family protein n=1 Tax=Kocuria sp. TaxID=1871328 RepID=UPI0028121B8D|nr:histidine phosphatase family protein [Kocuria sp.]